MSGAGLAGERPAPLRDARPIRFAYIINRSCGLMVTLAWTVATVITVACVPSALKYSF